MPRTAAQAAASRKNGARSQGPVTDEGKARAARNARTYGFRSSEALLTDLDDEARFTELQEAVHARFKPVCPMEAAICARMVAALWRAERADQLEAEHWCLLPRGMKAGDKLRMGQILHHDENNRRQSLQTILRYQAEAMNGFNRALRALNLLRAARDGADSPPAPPAEPAETAPANQNRPAGPAPVLCTNEPEPAPPAPGLAGALPPGMTPRHPDWARFKAWNDHCVRQIEAFANGDLFQGTEPPSVSAAGTDEPSPAG
ncbi:MAG TPA: hypothetical protein VNS22_24720 [Geminicoccus sp.]|uniref:hypothetical protein n=1 Tax=Geminicoccus sp. TaxID=2024832 RepID=UPI002C5C707C|nr:hypothetical protein [Geminicoccus sp.]HWL71562.1 hypothetical protein [Geminicoccus sp.]